MSTRWVCGATMAMAAALPLAAQDETPIRNGAFAEARAAQGPLSVDQGFGVWTLEGGLGVPLHWGLNPALTGSVAVVRDAGAPSGCYLQLRAPAGTREAHISQPCDGLRGDRLYEVKAWLRGGPGRIGFYEYFADAPMRTPGVLNATGENAGWQEIRALYRPPAAGFRNAAIYLAAAPGQLLQVAAVQVLPVAGVAFPTAPIRVQTSFLGLAISSHGQLSEFSDRGTGENYADTMASQPLVTARRGQTTLPALGLTQEGDLLQIWFAEPGLQARLRLVAQPDYLTLALVSVEGAGVDSLRFCDLSLRLNDSFGALLNLAEENGFAACLLAANDRTHATSTPTPPGVRFQATAFAEYGLAEAQVALIAAPRERLPGVIEQVELDLGLPHPTRDGLWLRNHPGRFASYLMAHGTNETNIDAVIDFARNGFGCIELLNWWESTPTYAPSRRDFPNGMAGLKACADRIHAAGMQVGLHAMQGMVGWGGVGMKDPYVSPVADPRLLQDRHTTLAQDVDEQATEFALAEDLAAWPDQGDLFVDGELIRYTRRAGDRLEGCTRGLHGTRVAAHAAGTRVGHLVNCFPLWGHCIYAPAVGSSMIDEICDNLARVFDATDADMAYFDGGEELACQPPHWRNQGLIALGVMRRVKKPFFLGGNALYTNLSWHAITRGSPYYDPIYYGRDEFTLRFKGPNPAGHAKNLLVGDVGWFTPHVQSLSTHAVTPDEVMLLCLKALAGNAPISFIVAADNLYANRRTPEMLDAIRTCDQLKQAAWFAAEARRLLADSSQRHWLEADAAGLWQVLPLAMAPRRMLSAGEASGLAFANPHAAQAPWLRLRAATRIATPGDAANVVLATPDQGVPFSPDGTCVPELTQTVEMAAERSPDGAACIRYRAVNPGKAASGWCRLSRVFAQPLDLSRHRSLALWVHARTSGGILNVQLMNPHNGAREHYIPLDFDGWRRVTLEIAEEARFYDYTWPYHFADVMYRPFDYRGVTGVRLYLNAIPASAEAEVLVGRIEALAESAHSLADPVLELGGQTLRFPATLRPDEYIEMDWTGICRHFEANGGLVRQFRAEGAIHCPAGMAEVRFDCRRGEGLSPRAELILATRGAALANTPPTAVVPPPAPAESADLALLPAGSRGLRLVCGRYELVGEQPAADLTAFAETPKAWTLHHAGASPSPAGLTIRNQSAPQSADPADPRARWLETFEDLAAYSASPENDFAKFVLGGGKQLTDQGPVREGVSHSLAPDTEGPRPGARAVAYSATNAGPAQGWCAKGRRFAVPLDLRPTPVLSLWVHGDGRGESLRFQLRDADGNHADWLVPITFSGWQRLTFAAAERPDFDWSRTAYLIFYFNGLPAETTCTLRLAELKALPASATPASLTNPIVTLNGASLALPVTLAPGEALTLGPDGRLRIWTGGTAPAREVAVDAQGLVLRPGDNAVSLQPAAGTRPPDRVSVHLVPMPATP